MLAALVLVCSVSVTPDLRGCTADNARAVMHVPAEFASPCYLMNEVGAQRTVADNQTFPTDPQSVAVSSPFDFLRKQERSRLGHDFSFKLAPGTSEKVETGISAPVPSVEFSRLGACRDFVARPPSRRSYRPGLGRSGFSGLALVSAEAVAVSTTEAAKNHRPGLVNAVATPLVFAAKISKATRITSNIDQFASARNQPGMPVVRSGE